MNSVRMTNRFFSDEELHAIYNRSAEANPVYEALPFCERYIDAEIERLTYDDFIKWCSPNEDRIRTKVIFGSFGIETIVTYGTLREHLLHANSTIQIWADGGQTYREIEDMYAYSIEDATYDHEPSTAEHDLKAQEAEESILLASSQYKQTDSNGNNGRA